MAMRLYDAAFRETDSVNLGTRLFATAYDPRHPQTGNPGIVLPLHLLRRQGYRVFGDLASPGLSRQ